MKPGVKFACGSAAFVALVAAILVGSNREYVAEHAAQCVTETHGARVCEQPADGVKGLLECVAILSGLSGLIAGAAFRAGQRTKSPNGGEL
jgi:hypothetical protein